VTSVAKIGDVLAGRYRLESILGEGGMGAVYQATQLDLNRPVAVKIMLPTDDRKGEAVARFEREARVTAALHHPGVVKIFDFGRDEAGRFFLVMERLVGSVLRRHLEGRPLSPPARAIDIARQMADVLVATHAIGLVHRDLKPENVFLEQNLDGSDRVVVVDFGLGYIEEREDARRHTKEGVIAGTPAYMSPEQCAGKNVGIPSDVYALGCMLYEMLCGEPVFDGPSLQLLVKRSFEPPRPPSQRGQGLAIPYALEELVLAMLAKPPDARPSAREIVERLSDMRTGGRERGRPAQMLEGRAARMIPTVDAPAPRLGGDAVTYREVPREPPGGRPIATVGNLSDEVGLALRANGLTPVFVKEPPVPADAIAIFAPKQGDVVLTHLLSHGKPVLTDGAADDLDLVARMVGLGVTDVVSRPVRADQLTSKLERAVKKAARKQG
jgi:serine/threonine-protein kinase